MPRSLISRALEPLAAILWGLFLFWSVWLVVVWVAPINEKTLDLVREPQYIPMPENTEFIEIPMPLPPPPPASNQELRKAVLILAQRADVAWLALAVANLHLLITAGNGLRTARAWLGFTAGGTLLLGILNHHTGLPFGRMVFRDGFGVRLWDVALGWPLLWAMLLMSARESFLWLKPRASHLKVSLGTTALTMVTLANILPLAAYNRTGFTRGWWRWDDGNPRHLVSMPWWAWLTWAAVAWLLAFSLREKDVISAAAKRPMRAAVILAVLNLCTLALHARKAFL